LVGKTKAFLKENGLVLSPTGICNHMYVLFAALSADQAMTPFNSGYSGALGTIGKAKEILPCGDTKPVLYY
jgi:hypothetical protein